MEYHPKKLITRILESAGLFALSAYLLKLGVAFLKEIWAWLLLIAVIVAAAIVGYRVWKNRLKW
jgi:glucan phosphoethanolaminetransferase (alkaline phosphatase superfamily)